jgi:biotin-dependent carboxylase-like uncharacterized protein
MSGERTIEVVSPGARTTVQDSGRFGWAHLGVPTAGPADWLSHELANRLVGNDATAATFEATLLGPTFRVHGDAVFAVVGGVATVDGEAMPADASFRVRAGQRLSVRVTGGARAYVAVAGGVRTEPVLGSRSADTFAGIGPAALARGDRFELSCVDEPAVPRRLRRDRLPCQDGPLRVVLGPNDDWFTAESVHRFLGEEYTVRTSSDRVGVRLDGYALSRAREGELPTAGMVTGALQVPPDGQPILLLANHGPTGGYPVVAVVATADLPRAGQARPGNTLSFTAVSRDEAVAAYARLRSAVDSAVDG